MTLPFRFENLGVPQNASSQYCRNTITMLKTEKKNMSIYTAPDALQPFILAS